jgi:hypothetical protein
MISSLDEFLLLARKWESESISVCVMSVVKASEQVLAVVNVQGRITKLNSERLDVCDEKFESVASVRLQNASFRYGTASDMFPGRERAQALEDCVMITRDEDGEHALVAVFAVKEPESLVQPAHFA